MQELRDAGVMLRLIYRAMKQKGIDTEVIFARLGVDEAYVYTEQLRTPHSAQLYFWQVVEDVSGDKDIGLHLGQLLPAYNGQVLGCDVVFGVVENRLYFPASFLDHPSLHAEPELLDLHERFASEQVARLEKKDIVGQVERIVAELLDSGEVTLDVVAERLGIKSRTLRTRLTEAETSFNQALADFRYRLARQLLATTDESIDEIVYLTGFSEPSTFYRAFKRWSGMTPIEYRKIAKGKDAMVDAM